MAGTMHLMTPNGRTATCWPSEHRRWAESPGCSSARAAQRSCGTAPSPCWCSPANKREQTQKCPILLQNGALLTFPWVLVSAWQDRAVAAEGEHGQSDQCFRGAESKRNPGQEPDLGVGGFD